MPDDDSSAVLSRLGLRHRVGRRVRRFVEARVVPMREMVDLVDHLNRKVDDGAARLAHLETMLDELETAIERPSGPFSGDMTMAQILRRHPAAGRVLAREGLPDCSGCSVRFDETLSEAADAYGFDLDLLLARLQAVLR